MAHAKKKKHSSVGSNSGSTQENEQLDLYVGDILNLALSDLHGVIEVPCRSYDQPGFLRPDQPDGVVNDQVGDEVLQLVEATEVGLPGDTDPLLLIKLHLQVSQGPLVTLCDSYVL